jgi:hypothetical protein
MHENRSRHTYSYALGFLWKNRCDINPHEVGIFRKLGDDFTCVYPLGLTRYRSDRHKSLFGGSVHPVGDLIESLCEISDGKGFAETSSLFVLLPVAFASGILVVVGFIGGCIGRQLVCRDAVEVTVGCVSEGPGVSPAAMKTWRSGVPRPESVVTTSVGVCSSVGARGVPSWNGSESG